MAVTSMLCESRRRRKVKSNYFLDKLKTFRYIASQQPQWELALSGLGSKIHQAHHRYGLPSQGYPL
jgi:hypothetical protein